MSVQCPKSWNHIIEPIVWDQTDSEIRTLVSQVVLLIIKPHTLLDLRGAKQVARSRRARLHANRGWSLLRDGSRLFGFQATLQDAMCGRFLCDTSQDQHERSKNLLVPSRPIDRPQKTCALFSQRNDDFVLFEMGVDAGAHPRFHSIFLLHV